MKKQPKFLDSETEDSTQHVNFVTTAVKEI